MQIVEPYAKMCSPMMGYDDEKPIEFIPFSAADGRALMRRIEYAARISHRSEDLVTPTSYIRLLDSVVNNHGDFSVIEHEKITVEAVVDRGITHEWVRHRLFSYTQESTRFVNYLKKMFPSFIRPKFTPEQLQNGAGDVWEVAITHLENAYVSLINAGCAPQIARSVFPNALAAKIVVTGNLRSWRHFFIMRTSKETHPQMKEVSIPLLGMFQETIPMFFADIVPEQRQADMMRNLR